jgi:hypothetical protein
MSENLLDIANNNTKMERRKMKVFVNPLAPKIIRYDELITGNIE